MGIAKCSQIAYIILSHVRSTKLSICPCKELKMDDCIRYVCSTKPRPIMPA